MAYTDAKELAKDVINEIIHDLVDYCIEVEDDPPYQYSRLPQYLYDRLQRFFDECTQYPNYSTAEIDSILERYGSFVGYPDSLITVQDLSGYRDAGRLLAQQAIKNAAEVEIAQIFEKFNSIDFDFYIEVDEDGDFIPEAERSQVLKEWFEHELRLILEGH